MARSKIFIAKAGQECQALENEEWEGDRGSTIYAGYRSTVTSSGDVTCGEGSMTFGRNGAHLTGLSGSTFYAKDCTFEAFPGSKGFAEAGSSGIVHPGANVVSRGGILKAPGSK
jgi:hypothetical protein